MYWLYYSLPVVVVVVSILALIYKEKKPRPTCDKTQHLVVNDDFPDKNHADEKILLPKENETSVENSYLDFDKTTEKINTTSALECSGYGSTEDGLIKTQLDSDLSSLSCSLSPIIPQEIFLREKCNSIVNCANNLSIENEESSHKLSVGSTEDEGNGSQDEEEKVSSFLFYGHKNNNISRFNLNGIGDIENNENEQSPTEIIDNRSGLDSPSWINESYESQRDCSILSSPFTSDGSSSFGSISTIHSYGCSFEDAIQTADDCENASCYDSSVSGDEMNSAFIGN